MIRSSGASNRTSVGADIAPTRARWILAVILVVALVVRVVYVLQSAASPIFQDPQLDALYHIEWARAFASGHEYQPGPFFRAPIYPWFLGTLFKIFGEDLTLVRLVQACIGTASCALVYAVGARAFDRRTGLVAAGLAATYWILVYFDGEILLPVLEVPLCLLTLWCALRFEESRTLRRAVACGVALALAALVRPNFLVLAPIFGAWIVFSEPGAWRKAWKSSARPVGAFALAVLLPIAPITLYNAIVGHDQVLISSQSGVNLWIGNNPTSDGASAIAPGTRQDWWGGFEDTVRQAEAAEGRTLKPSEVSAYYTRRALAFWRDEPSRALALTARKVRFLWMDWEIGNNQDERFFALHFGPILRFLPIGFGLLAPLALLGLVLALQRPSRHFPLWVFVPAYSVTVVLFFVCSRYRVPLLPVLMIFAAHAFFGIVDAWRARRWLILALEFVFLLVIGSAVHVVPDSFDKTDSKALWQLGLARERSGDLDGAIDLYRRAIAENPRNANAYRSLGSSLYHAGDVDAALAALKAGLDIDPTMVLALQVRAEIELGQARYDDSITTARRMQSVGPTYGPAYYAEGAAAYARALSQRPTQPTSTAVEEDLAAAERAMSRAWQNGASVDDRFNAAFARGEIAMLRGLPQAALLHYEEALALYTSPDDAGWFWRAQERRLSACLAAGESSRARSIANELRARYANDGRAIEATRAALH